MRLQRNSIGDTIRGIDDEHEIEVRIDHALVKRFTVGGQYKGFDPGFAERGARRRHRGPAAAYLPSDRRRGLEFGCRSRRARGSSPRRSPTPRRRYQRSCRWRVLAEAVDFTDDAGDAGHRHDRDLGPVQRRRCRRTRRAAGGFSSCRPTSEQRRRAVRADDSRHAGATRLSPAGHRRRPAAADAALRAAASEGGFRRAASGAPSKRCSRRRRS